LSGITIRLMGAKYDFFFMRFSGCPTQPHFESGVNSFAWAWDGITVRAANYEMLRVRAQHIALSTIRDSTTAT